MYVGFGCLLGPIQNPSIPTFHRGFDAAPPWNEDEVVQYLSIVSSRKTLGFIVILLNETSVAVSANREVSMW